MASSRYERVSLGNLESLLPFPGVLAPAIIRSWVIAALDTLRHVPSPTLPATVQDEGSPRVFSATSSQSSFGAYMGCESTGDASGSTPCSEQYDEDRAGPRTPCASSDEDLVAAFLSTSQVYPVLCALVRRQQLAVTSPRRHANGDCRQTLAGTGRFRRGMCGEGSWAPGWGLRGLRPPPFT